ncbi:hypothetical protein NDU88_003028 [Pleurodeles waltl]|uniref:Uncharacterized protein n=1 Tax=Pleurodeles waltl TaxID=8319 RepID=A0AAV7M377_PLEWA|nr:hypothetical protein NDU88_003028 [Pleurodeles waltl]
MPSNKASAGKRKGRDPELSQLLKMVLAKLGNDDSDSIDAASDNDVNGTNSSRPRRSNVVPRTAFPLARRRNKGRAPAPQSSPTVVTPPEQSSMPETLVPSSSVASEHHVGGVGAITTPGQGVADVLADIRKSLASLFAPSMGPGVTSSPQPGVPASAALPVVSPTPQVPTQATQAQDPNTQALLEVSRLLATINVPASNPPIPPPTTPWNLNHSLQNSVAELKRQVDALSTARSFIPLQAVSGSLSVTPALGTVIPATPVDTNRLNEINKAPAKDNLATGGQASMHCCQDQVSWQHMFVPK